MVSWRRANYAILGLATKSAARERRTRQQRQGKVVYYG